MSITDELREWFKDRIFMANGWQEIRDIADRIDAELAERYVKLPVDADGVPIRVGDVMAYEDNTKPKEVVALVPPSVVMVEDGPRFADSCRHYKPPTVEDVLDEMLQRFAEDSYEGDLIDFIASYATKLQLKED